MLHATKFVVEEIIADTEAIKRKLDILTYGHREIKTSASEYLLAAERLKQALLSLPQ